MLALIRLIVSHNRTRKPKINLFLAKETARFRLCCCAAAPSRNTLFEAFHTFFGGHLLDPLAVSQLRLLPLGGLDLPLLVPQFGRRVAAHLFLQVFGGRLPTLVEPHSRGRNGGSGENDHDDMAGWLVGNQK